MTKSECIDLLEKEVKDLKINEIEEVLDFIGYLKWKEEEEATREILADKKFMRSIKRGLADLKAKRVYPWKEIKGNV